MNTFLEEDKGIKLIKNAKYHLGDIVQVADYGESYEYYDTAFRKMNGIAFNLSNISSKMERFYLGLNSNEREQYKKFLIVGKCLHQNQTDILYLLFHPRTKRGIMLHEDGIALVQKNPYQVEENNITFKIC